MKTYDLIIIGGSAAGVTAGIYGKRRGLNLKMISKNFGGEVITSGEIGNWPGDGNTDGIALAQKFRDHLALYGVEPEEGIAVEGIVRKDDGTFVVSASRDDAPETKIEYTAKTVLVATGVHPRKLDIPGEKEFRAKGVTYCTTCDGPLFQGKVTAVIGGGNSALEAGLMLSDIASRTYVINKNTQFKGDDILIEKLKAKKNVEIIYNALTSEIIGNGFVTGLKYKDANGEHELKVDGTFIHIGNTPNSDIVPEGTEKNEFGEIKVNANCETNIPGLYAAGDVANSPFKQIVIAAAQGCIAALSAVQYLNKLIK